MKEYVMKKRWENPIVSGLMSVLVVLVVASLGWVIWSQVFKGIFAAIAGAPLASADAALRDKFLLDAVEGSYFWLIISTWVWFTLDLGNYGKYKKTTKQPQAGLYYLGLALLVGVVAFFVFTGFIGLWLKPFSWDVLFTPANADEIQLAIKGWGATNFFALAVIIGQISVVSLFQKYPFSKYTKDSWAVAFGTLFFTFLLALLVWLALIFPSYFPNLVLGDTGLAVSSQPMGSWATVLAWAQIFIFLFLLPAEGGELFPQKLVTAKQPWSGLVGLAIAFLGAWILRPLISSAMTPMAESLGIAPDLATAALVLTCINVLLTWHHHFFDFPSTEKQPNQVARLLTRLAIVVVGGVLLGLFWMNSQKYLPFGGNDLGLGHPMLGLMGGQFVYMMPMLFMNTFFDKWPVMKSVEKK